MGSSRDGRPTLDEVAAVFAALRTYAIRLHRDTEPVVEDATLLLDELAASIERVKAVTR